MKSVFSWSFAVLGLALALTLFVLNRSVRADRASLQHRLVEMETVEEEEQSPPEPQTTLTAEEQKEYEQLVAETKDLPKLRAQYQTLKQETQQSRLLVEKEQQKAREEASRLLGERRALTIAQQVPPAQAPAPPDPVQNACINNLRQLESAKEQFGLEHRLPGNYVPQEQEIIGDDKYIKATPVCPAGGTYTLNAIQQRPVCSIPGHDLR